MFCVVCVFVRAINHCLGSKQHGGSVSTFSLLVFEVKVETHNPVTCSSKRHRVTHSLTSCALCWCLRRVVTMSSRSASGQSWNMTSPCGWPPYRCTSPLSPPSRHRKSPSSTSSKCQILAPFRRQRTEMLLPNHPSISLIFVSISKSVPA